MDPVFGIALWATLFIVTHLMLSSSSVRPRLVAALGDQPFRGIYSLVAIATLAPLIVTFAHHKHVGLMLWYLRDIAAVRWLTIILMCVAMIFFAGSFVTPNPGAIGAPGDARVRGILKITRHPSFVSFILFGFAHMLMNGWVGDLFFFSSFALLGVVGGIHQDNRKLHELGEPYRRMIAETSFVPGAALIAGRQRVTASDIPWTAVGIGFAMAIALIIFHPYLFGGHPLR